MSKQCSETFVSQCFQMYNCIPSVWDQPLIAFNRSYGERGGARWCLTNGVNVSHTSLIPNINTSGYLETENNTAATSEVDKVLATITASRSSIVCRRSLTELGSDTVLREWASVPHHRLQRGQRWVIRQTNITPSFGDWAKSTTKILESFSRATHILPMHSSHATHRAGAEVIVLDRFSHM